MVQWNERVEDASEMKRLRERLRESLRAERAREHRIYDAELVLTELVSNALRYGEKTVGVFVLADAGEAVIEVIDAAPPFEVDADRRGHLREGGRGITLVRALAKRFEVTRLAKGNHARAIVSLDSEA
jgi:anti-sigma regulatory factor (Ser/Thr protein kinase)